MNNFDSFYDDNNLDFKNIDIKILLSGLANRIFIGSVDQCDFDLIKNYMEQNNINMNLIEY